MTINGWISNETKGKITDLLRKNDIDGSTRVVLVNAAYFQGKWLKPFDPKDTEELPFHPSDDNVLNTPMMTQTAFYPYAETDAVQILAIPFQTCDTTDPQINCVIVLPKTAADMEELDNTISASMLADWLKDLEQQKVNVLMPKFCMKQRFDLSKALSTMGMPEAFGPNADFSGIDGMHDLYLSKVLHETYFLLNEFGVEAAAASSAVMNLTSTGETTPPVQFTADHPFYFFLIDLKTNAILFAGKLVQPETACQ